jgi:hypothetical protein
MKTPPLKKNDQGGYDGALSQATELSPQEKKEIRRATEPLHITQIAQKAQIALTNPHKQSALAHFVGVYLINTRETQMSFQRGAKGRERFAGWSATEHARDLFAKGLS